MVHVFRHWASRELEPQLHFHMLFSNQVFCEERQDFLALSAEKLVELKFYYDAVAQYEVVRRLQEMGYEAKLTSRAHAVLKDDRELIDHFSTRTAQVLAVAGPEADTRTQKRATIATRSNKKSVPLEELFQSWFSELKELGKEDFAPEKTYEGPLGEEAVQKAIQDAVEKLEEEKGVFRFEDLEREVLVQLGLLAAQTGRTLPPTQRFTGSYRKK